MGNEELGGHRGRKECLLCDAECESVVGNEELGRHRGRKECLLCDAECESVSHVLWVMKSWAGIYRGREGRKECLLCDAECERLSCIC